MKKVHLRKLKTVELWKNMRIRKRRFNIFVYAEYSQLYIRLCEWIYTFWRYITPCCTMLVNMKYSIMTNGKRT